MNEPAFTWDWRTGLMFCISFLVSALSMPAGFGGGIIFVPLINSLLQFEPREAAVQSQALILGGALGSGWVSLCRQHPTDESRTLIDFDMVLILLPVMLLGVAVGVLLNSLCPNYLITFLLLAMLVWQTYNALRRSLLLLRKERAARSAQQQQQQQPAPSSTRAVSCFSSAPPSLAGTGWRTPLCGPSAPGTASCSPLGTPHHPRTQDGPSPDNLGALLCRSLQELYPEIPTSAAPAQRWEEAGEAGPAEDAPGCSAAHAQASLDPLDEDYKEGKALDDDDLEAAQQGLQPVGAIQLQARSAATGGGLAFEAASLAACLPRLRMSRADLAPTPPSEGSQLDEREEHHYGTSRARAAAGAGCTQLCAVEVAVVPVARAQQSRPPQPWFGLASAPKMDASTWRKLGVVFFIWSVFVVLQTLKVDYTTRTGTRCAVGYYIYFGVEAAFLLVAAGAYAMWVHRSRVRAHPEPQQAAAGSAAGKAAPAAKPAQAPTGLGTRDSAMEQEGGRPGVGPESDWSIAAVLPSTQDGDSTTVPAAAGMAEANAPRPAAGAAAGQLGVGESSGAESKGAAEWSVGTILTIQLVMVFGGTLATMLGLGGGMVVGPLLLHLHIHPLITSATSGFLVLLSVSSATISYAVRGQLPTDYSLIFGAACFAGALLGVVVVNGVVRRTGAASLVVFLMTAVLAAGVAVCASYSMPHAVEQLADGQDIGFVPFCRRSGGRV